MLRPQVSYRQIQGGCAPGGAHPPSSLALLTDGDHRQNFAYDHLHRDHLLWSIALTSQALRLGKAPTKDWTAKLSSQKALCKSARSETGLLGARLLSILDRSGWEQHGKCGGRTREGDGYGDAGSAR